MLKSAEARQGWADAGRQGHTLLTHSRQTAADVLLPRPPLIIITAKPRASVFNKHLTELQVQSHTRLFVHRTLTDDPTPLSVQNHWVPISVMIQYLGIASFYLRLWLMKVKCCVPGNRAC